MIKAGVIGNPISHSKSPRLHNHWLNILGIKGQYSRIFAEIDAFDNKINELKNLGYKGCNVTLPFKEDAARIAKAPSDFVQKNHAANTLVFSQNGIEAHNTDGYGFAHNILDHFPNWNVQGDHIVLGAGGAAKAIVSWLFDAGARSILIVNRNQERAQSLAKLGENIKAITWEELPKHLANKTTLINTTSLGMNGKNNIQIDWQNASPDMIVNDIVYTPLVTSFLRDAANQGLRTVDGLGMLLWQARPGFKAWFGSEPPIIDQGLRNFMLSKKVVALTGSIGMGKSTVAAMFSEFGFQIWEADIEVTKLYDDDSDLHAFIKKHEPQAFQGGFNKAVWREYVFANPEIFPSLEKLIHEKIVNSRRAFLEGDALFKLCDIPLLFETNGEALYDEVIVVSANEDVQKERVLARGTMSESQFEKINAKQIPDKEKRSRASIIIPTDVDIQDTQTQVKAIVNQWGIY